MFKIYFIEGNLNSKHHGLLQLVKNEFPLITSEFIDSSHAICNKFSITRFPTILLTKNESFLNKMTGIFTLNRYKDFIENNIS